MVDEIEASLKERDVLTGDDAILSPETRVRDTPKTNGKMNGLKLEKRHIEQRIEEDRERHKRLKESIWEVSGADDDEFNQLWEEVSDIGEDDYMKAEDEEAERKRCFAIEAFEASYVDAIG